MDFNDTDNDQESDDSDYERFTNNYESYNAKKLSLFKKSTHNDTGEANEDDEDDDELNRVD